MQFRYFQIIIPLLALMFIIRQVLDHRRTRIGIYETFIVISFWIAVVVLSFFPDFLSKFVAKIFGIKNNVNAIIFVAIGLLFYLQLQLFKLIYKQDRLITELVQKIALDNPEGEEPNS